MRRAHGVNRAPPRHEEGRENIPITRRKEKPLAEKLSHGRLCARRLRRIGSDERGARGNAR